MRNRKNFNNMFDSLCATALFISCLAFYLIIIWFGVINPKDGTNPIATMIISTFFWGFMISITVILIVKYCYEYWVLAGDYLYTKRLFRKKIIINLNEIDKVEKKIVPAFIMGLYKSDAYVICSKNKKIVILINKKKRFCDLEQEIANYLKNK